MGLFCSFEIGHIILTSASVITALSDPPLSLLKGLLWLHWATQIMQGKAPSEDP